MPTCYLDLTVLVGANLEKATLDDAIFMHSPDFSDANLRDAEGITKEELEKQTYLLKGATMPDGSEHE